MIAKKRGGKCISKTYIKYTDKLKWKCRFGHEWSARFSHIKQSKSWCPYCAGNVKLTIDDCVAIAAEKHGKCISSVYLNSKTKIIWECKYGHQWPATPECVRYSTWCPYCAGRKKTIADCINIAQEKGGKCLSLKYTRSDSNLIWQCGKCEYIWNACWDNIKQGKWCPKCAGRLKLDIAECKIFAESKGGECLSKEYTNINSNMTWKCNIGHIWSTSFNSLKSNKTWCPSCPTAHSKHELEIYNFVKEIYHDAQNGIRGLLKNKKFELDIYIPSLNKAIEYDGQYWHQNKVVKNRDNRKNKQCNNKKIALLRIKDTDFIKDSKLIYDKIRIFLEE